MPPAIAIKQGLTYTEFGEMIFPYLTTLEGRTLAVQTFDMDLSKLSCCAGSGMRWLSNRNSVDGAR